jgi:hypothetical protein
MNSTRLELKSHGSAKALLALQLALTLAVLALVPGAWPKLAALLLCWAATFRTVTKPELLACFGVSGLFSVMDIMAVRQGVFAFDAPDYLGLPVWEFFMWGFYVLHALRMLDGPSARGSPWRAVALGLLFAVPFASIADPWLLLAASGSALALALAFFHERDDWTYVGYMVVVGALVEYVGVWSGQWHYPQSPPGGVPLWFVTMWGGVGLFTRRLLVPLLDGKSWLATARA